MSRWILRGARVALGANAAERLDVEVGSRGIARMAPALPARAGVRVLELDGHLLLPGLVNAHDHLEFNLFPRLGTGPYRNATEWAHDIYRPDASPVREHRAVPRTLRLFWGGLKNLLCGAITVWHHNPPDESLYAADFPVRVERRCGWAHSLAFSPDLAHRFRATPRAWPFAVHAGEGVDECARAEVFRLEELGCLDRRTVLVHAVGLDEPGLALAGARRASLVWCPSSNLFLFGRTLRPAAFRLPVVLGSDSALTAAGDLLDEIRVAAGLGLVSTERLYNMVARSQRDVIAIPDTGGTPAEALVRAAAPVLAIAGGRLVFVTPELMPELRGRWCRLEPEGRNAVLVPIDVRPLHAAVSDVLGSDWRLAGRRIAADN